MRRTAPLIVGGGPAGSVAALLLARGGLRPTLLERSREDEDALCGGFLSWRTLAQLDALGIDLPRGARVTRLRIFAGVTVGEAALPAPALGLSRRALDTSLRNAASIAGAGIERGIAAQAWQDGALRLGDGATLTPATLLLATGKHDLRGLTRPRDAAGGDPAVGLRVRLAAHPSLTRLVADAIELHLFDGGYAGIVMQEDGANLCLACDKSRLTAAGGPEGLLAEIAHLPHLGERLAHRAAGPADAVGHVPYGWRARATEPGVWRLGDQAAVIHSLAGEGMGIAIASGRDAAAAVLNGEDATTYQAAFAGKAARPLAVASAVRRVARPRLLEPWVARAARMPGLAMLVARASRVPN